MSVVFGRPEPPSSYQYNAPSPSSSYGPPSPQYGAPAPQYGVPSQAPIIHKHVYVHVPPPEPEYIAPRFANLVSHLEREKISLSFSLSNFSYNCSIKCVFSIMNLHETVVTDCYFNTLVSKLFSHTISPTLSTLLWNTF